MSSVTHNKHTVKMHAEGSHQTEITICTISQHDCPYDKAQSLTVKGFLHFEGDMVSHLVLWSSNGKCSLLLTV